MEVKAESCPLCGNVIIAEHEINDPDEFDSSYFADIEERRLEHMCPAEITAYEEMIEKQVDASLEAMMPTEEEYEASHNVDVDEEEMDELRDILPSDEDVFDGDDDEPF